VLPEEAAPVVSHSVFVISAVLGVHEMENLPPFSSCPPLKRNVEARPEDGEHVAKVDVSQDVMRTESENWIVTADAVFRESFLRDSEAASAAQTTTTTPSKTRARTRRTTETSSSANR
jgi:hypothetical protein